jgi:hypothetical protein
MLRYTHMFEDVAIPGRGTPAIQRLTKAQISRRVRAHIGTSLFDDSGVSATDVAIYALSDPRDIRDVRYIGQTSAPRRRFLQHLNAGRLWLPDSLPWWVRSPKLRPLYGWIRALYSHDGRLPVMIITDWAPSLKDALSVERARIVECLKQDRNLFNVEREALGPRLLLL